MKVFLFAAAALVPPALLLSGCGTETTGLAASANAVGGMSSAQVASALDHYTLTGNTSLVRDPSIAFANGEYYEFSTDAPAAGPDGSLPVRCSADLNNWQLCGYVFSAIPDWVMQAVPGIDGLWAPDISYFNGEYHLYYSGSALGQQESVIGEATNVTLDPSSPDYEWVDHGLVIASRHGDDFDAIDPNILVDTDGSVWLTYGSYWTGIKQRRVDPETGMLSKTDTKVYSLAARPDLKDHAIEGGSLVHHGEYYYLFASQNHCCLPDYLDDNYQEIVGRSESPHGPFLDADGVSLMTNGGTVLLKGEGDWLAPGGATMYLDAAQGQSLMVFHAARLSEQGRAHLWVKQVGWVNGWPVLE